MSAINGNFGLLGPISAIVIALFVAQADANELMASTPTDDCLAAPNSPAPQGSRWISRWERKTHRRCWYVRASAEIKQKPAQRNVAGAAIPLPRPRVQALPARSDIVSSLTPNALPAPALMSTEHGTEGVETTPNPEQDKKSSIEPKPVPRSSISSEPSVQDIAPVLSAPTTKSAADAYMRSVHDASDNLTDKALNARAEALPMPNASNAATDQTTPDNRAAQTSGSTESNLQTFAPMPRVAPGFSTPVPNASNAATDQTTPDNRAAQTSGSTESNLQTFAPMPRIAPGFSTPVDDFAERGVQEGLTPPVSPKTSMSAVSATPELDTQVAGPARKVEPTSSPSTIGLLDERQQPGTPPMIQTGLQSRFHGVGIDVQTLIAIALTLAAGLVVVGMVTRVSLLDRAARRKMVAATERQDPYDDAEFYRALRETNFESP